MKDITQEYEMDIYRRWDLGEHDTQDETSICDWRVTICILISDHNIYKDVQDMFFSWYSSILYESTIPREPTYNVTSTFDPMSPYLSYRYRRHPILHRDDHIRYRNSIWMRIQISSTALSSQMITSLIFIAANSRSWYPSISKHFFSDLRTLNTLLSIIVIS